MKINLINGECIYIDNNLFPNDHESRNSETSYLNEFKIKDCSVFFLRYGKKSYDIYSKLLVDNINNIEEFLNSEKSFFEELFKEWKVVNVQYFGSSSFILFEKNPSNYDLILNKVLSNKLQIIKCEL